MPPTFSPTEVKVLNRYLIMVKSSSKYTGPPRSYVLLTRDARLHITLWSTCFIYLLHATLQNVI